MNKRIYLELLDGNKALTIENLIKRHLGQEISGTKTYQVYEFTNSSEEAITAFVNNVLKDDLVNVISEVVDTKESYIAYKAVDGQYDQITEWSNEFLSEGHVIVGDLIVFNEVVDLDAVKRLVVNPLEFQTMDIHEFTPIKKGVKKPLKTYPTFITDSEDELRTFYKEHGFAMEFEDLVYVQDYFKSEDRNPTETELLVLDTYWSDHCRHTTFMSSIEDVTFNEFELRDAVEKSFYEYLEDKKELGREDKILSLMDITAQNSRYARNVWKDNVIEVSDEVNACSIRISVDVDGVEEPWLLMFKNETHNHPTEIEPYGGASTCIGGAIRDPLSGRAYVYQAMRITGSGNVLETLDETRADKLPQAFISQQAAAGYSHYADQIGMSSSYVKEIYHDSYKAKRMELGAVVGAVKESDLIRQQPVNGDVIVMMGGRTGRDGVGGATGSSDVTTTESSETNAAEVQKGNALEERKIMRLFRKPEISSIIKKSNDFGAGGVSVAIGELADGLEINLDLVKLKYDDMNATEIAISESQERMAVVLDPKHVDFFLEKAAEENVEAVVVAWVNDSHRLVIKDAQGTYVDLDRSFLDSGGITQKVSAVIEETGNANPFINTYGLNKDEILNELSKLENASQAGLAQRFNSHGALIKPLLGKTYLSPNIGSVESIPVLKGETTTVSMLTHGFIPEVSEYSPYIGGSLAVVESLSKTVAMGGDFRKVYFSFQEYFNRLTNPSRWGRVMQALLGTYSAQKAFKLCAIGGKDSMSGSYEDLDVVDTLVSFACSPQKLENLVTSELKETTSNLYMIETPMDTLGNVDYEAMIAHYDAFHELVLQGNIAAASTTDDTSALMTIIKMLLGNKVGVELETLEVLSQLKPGSIIFQTEKELDGFTKLGVTNSSETLVVNGNTITVAELIEAFTKTLSPVYPFELETVEEKAVNVSSTDATPSKEISILVPVFLGTVGEYDVEKVFNKYDAKVTTFIYQDNPDAFAKAITNSDIVVFADGAVNGDVPSIGAYGLYVLNQTSVKTAIEKHLADSKQVLGFGNGFQILVKSGLIPFEKVGESTMSFKENIKGGRISLDLEVAAQIDNKWTANNASEVLYQSNTYGALVGFVNEDNVVYKYSKVNPSGSLMNIEALQSNNGNVFGRFGEITDVIVKNALNGVSHE